MQKEKIEAKITGNIIFLDIDGVFNCQLFYTESQRIRKKLRKDVKAGVIDGDNYYKESLCSIRIGWFNELCKSVDAKVVISSTWRHGKTISELQSILNNSGASFEIIDITPCLRFEGSVRGNEIKAWIDTNIEKPYNFKSYVIIDDDSDILYWQRNNFFQTDNYSGLTPTICYKIKAFFTGEFS